MKHAEEKLPRHILAKTFQKGMARYWRVEDIPAVIEGAREAGLSNIGGSLFFIIPPSTRNADAATCECYWVGVSVNTPPGREWSATIDDTARQAQQQFATLLKTYDFHKEELGFPSVAAYRKRGGDLNDIMYFEWLVKEREAHQ